MQNIEDVIRSLAHEGLVSVTLEYRCGPGLHDFRYIYTSMSGETLQTFEPSEGMSIVGVCSLDDEWD